MGRHLAFILAALMFARVSADAEVDSATRPASQPVGSPLAHFLRLSDSADSVVFICDNSTSMLTKFRPLCTELKRAVAEMTAGQKFNVVFMRLHGFTAFQPGLVLRHAQTTDRALSSFLADLRADPVSNPIPAIEAAFALHPRVVYLVTDGDFFDNDAVVKCVHDLNVNRNVRVYTVALIDKTDDTDYERTLKTIAAENGGAFRLVHLEDLPSR